MNLVKGIYKNLNNKGLKNSSSIRTASETWNKNIAKQDGDISRSLKLYSQEDKNQ